MKGTDFLESKGFSDDALSTGDQWPQNLPRELHPSPSCTGRTIQSKRSTTMSIKHALLLSTVLIYLVLSPTAMQAANPHFSAIYVFGDSYCDVGNLSSATDGEFPARFTSTAASPTDQSGLNI
jgi:hypothetical protein